MQNDQQIISFRLSCSKLDHQRIREYIKQGAEEFGSTAAYIRHAILSYEESRNGERTCKDADFMENMLRRVLQEEIQSLGNKMLWQGKRAGTYEYVYQSAEDKGREEEPDAAFKDKMITTMFEDC